MYEAPAIETYEAPAIEELGTVAEMTEASEGGAITDADFPTGTLFADITFSG